MFSSHVERMVGARGERLVELAVLIEQAGADQIVFSEHVVLASNIEPHGPGGAPFPYPADHNYPEPLIALAAIAGATQRLRLATGILIAPMRPAVVLAKMAATLDVISGGRLDLGLGAGWHAAELRSAGVDPATATQALEDTLGACRALWSGGPASFRSPSIEFENLYCHPCPSSGASLPVWLAGPCTRPTFRRVARLGDGWLPFGNLTPDDIARGSELLDQAASEFGRDRASLGIRASLPVGTGPPRARVEHALAAAPAFLAAGATALQLPLARLAHDLDTAFEITELAARELHALNTSPAGESPLR
jgi:probable F420-dependent oxidoreductase